MRRRRTTLGDVRQAIRTIMLQATEDAHSDVEYCRLTGRGRLLAMEILCTLVGFPELEKEIKKVIDSSYATEQQLLREKLEKS